MSEVRVIGAGFTGTLAAYFLSQRGHSVTVVDPGEHTGGMIRTIRHDRGDEEAAANGFMASALIERVADDIGVKLVPVSPVARKNRFLWHASANRLARWPLSIAETLKFAWRVLIGLVRGRMAPRPLETVESWGLRTLGEAATRKILGAVLLGIYAAPASQLSATLVLGRFFGRSKGQGGQRPRSRLRGTVAPEKGMGEWFVAMRRYLERRGVRFLREEAVPLTPGCKPTIICTGARSASRLVSVVAPQLSSRLERIPMVPIVTVGIVDSAGVSDPRGFGCLFPPEASFSSLGVLFSSDIFPHRFASGVRGEAWIMGGAVRPELVQRSDDELRELVRKDRARLGGSGSVEGLTITRWPAAFPLYGIGLEQILADLPSPPPGVVLAGNYLGRLGLSRLAEQVEETVEAFTP